MGGSYQRPLSQHSALSKMSLCSSTAPDKIDDVDPFTLEEQKLIFEKLSGQELNFFQFAFWTGMRTSELIGLEWGDVDWIRGVIEVRRALTTAAIQTKLGGEIPKTRAGKREVKLLAPAMAALTAQKAHTFIAGEQIFNNPRTKMRWGGDSPIRKIWKRALLLAKVRYRRPYQTRHTFASMMLTAGESPMWVAQQMGHKDWTMIAKVYGKWIKDAMPDAGNKAVEMFGNAGKKAVISRLKQAI